MAVVKCLVPRALRSLSGGAPEVDLDARDVAEAVGLLVAKYPGLSRHLLGADGTLRSSVGVFLNDKDLRALEGSGTPLREGDVLRLVPPLAGGSTDEAKSHRAPFSDAALRRYSRHLLLPEVGMDGQRALAAARVAVVGAGGLGSPAALYLAAAGVGEIGLIEFDQVDLSNLQRQVLFATTDVGRSKLEAASARLESLNPETRVTRHAVRLEAGNALDVLGRYQVVIDATDNFATRYLVNDACVRLGIPDVYGSVYRFEGQVSVFGAADGPCYRCLFPEPPPPELVPSCAEAGVLGVLPGVIGTMQATEAVKWLLGIGRPLVGRLLLYDALASQFRELELSRDPECVRCSAAHRGDPLIDYDEFCATPAGVAPVPEVSAPELARELRSPEPPVLVDVREPFEREISVLEPSLAVPQHELPSRLADLATARSLVVYCRSGHRSATAVRTLQELGLVNVRHLKGGINEWARTVDPTIAVY